MKFYLTVKRKNMHFATKLYWSTSETKKIMLCQPR